MTDATFESERQLNAMQIGSAYSSPRPHVTGPTAPAAVAPLILVVEDDRRMLTYLRTTLTDQHLRAGELIQQAGFAHVRPAKKRNLRHIRLRKLSRRHGRKQKLCRIAHRVGKWVRVSRQILFEDTGPARGTGFRRSRALW